MTTLDRIESELLERAKTAHNVQSRRKTQAGTLRVCCWETFRGLKFDYLLRHRQLSRDEAEALLEARQ